MARSRIPEPARQYPRRSGLQRVASSQGRAGAGPFSPDQWLQHVDVLEPLGRVLVVGFQSDTRRPAEAAETLAFRDKPEACLG